MRICLCATVSICIHKHVFVLAGLVLNAYALNLTFQHCPKLAKDPESCGRDQFSHFLSYAPPSSLLDPFFVA